MYEADDEKICRSPEYLNRPEAAAAATAGPKGAATPKEQRSEDPEHRCNRAKRWMIMNVSTVDHVMAKFG